MGFQAEMQVDCMLYIIIYLLCIIIYSFNTLCIVTICVYKQKGLPNSSRPSAHSPMSQLRPRKPSWHSHWYSFGSVLVQVPPFLQGWWVPQKLRSKAQQKSIKHNIIKKLCAQDDKEKNMRTDWGKMRWIQVEFWLCKSVIASLWSPVLKLKAFLSLTVSCIPTVSLSHFSSLQTYPECTETPSDPT